MTMAGAGTLTEIVRLREDPGGYDNTGRWQPGAVVETVLLAMVQPLGLTDAETAGGSQYRNRVKVFVPHADVLVWGGTGSLVDDDAPLVAAFSDRGADLVQIGAVDYVVEVSEAWGSHTEAVLLREP